MVDVLPNTPFRIIGFEINLVDGKLAKRFTKSL